MFKKCLQLLKSRGCAVLFGIVLISSCTVSAEASSYELSGDGLFLYNAVLCPPLPDVGLQYPYLYMNVGYLDDNPQDYAVVLSCSTDQPRFDLSTDGVYTWIYPVGSPYRNIYTYLYVSSQNAADAMGLPFSDDWISIGLDEDEDYSQGAYTPYLWSNFQPLDLNGDSASLLSQVPYDMSGMNCVLFRSSDSNHTFEVGPYLDIPSKAVAVSCSIFSTFPKTYNGGNYYTDISLNDDGWSIFADQNILLVNSSVSADLLSMEYHRFVGCSLFAYKSDSAPAIDFSNTELTISNPEYDFQSANFDVSWSNLPNIPYPDSVQYYLTAHLNDSSPATHPYTYIGSSSDPPSGDIPVWFQFDDLQPETAYTVTVELRYASGDNASFANSVSSGVTATVSFTTLSDGSISEGDKAIINAIQQGNKDNQQWIDSNMGAAVGDLPEDTTETDSILDNLDEQESEYHADAVNKFNELSSTFQGFDGSVSSGISLASTLFSRVWNSMGNYVIVYTFPLLLGLALVIIGRVSRVHLPGSGDRTKGKDES